MTEVAQARPVATKHVTRFVVDVTFGVLFFIFILVVGYGFSARYELTVTPDSSVYRLDHWTGKTKLIQQSGRPLPAAFD